MHVPPGKIKNPKTGRCINKPKEKTHKRRGRPKKSVMPEKSKSPPVSNYYQKQYEKFMKTTEKDDLKEAFVDYFAETHHVVSFLQQFLDHVPYCPQYFS